MKPESINPSVREYIKVSQFTSDQDIDRVLRFGLIATHATQFAEHVAYHFGSDAVYFLNEFYRNFLGEFPLICLDKSPYLSIMRLCEQITPNGQDGVEIQISKQGEQLIVRLYQLACAFDITTRKLVKEYK